MTIRHLITVLIVQIILIMIKNLVINVFKTLRDNEVEYSIIRGWNGDVVIGSDVDI